MDLNLRPAAYKAAALPTELWGHWCVVITSSGRVGCLLQRFDCEADMTRAFETVAVRGLPGLGLRSRVSDPRRR